MGNMYWIIEFDVCDLKSCSSMIIALCAKFGGKMYWFEARFIKWGFWEPTGGLIVRITVRPQGSVIVDLFLDLNGSESYLLY
jgi:hypothetical protein